MNQCSTWWLLYKDEPHSGTFISEGEWGYGVEENPNNLNFGKIYNEEKQIFLEVSIVGRYIHMDLW